MAQRLGVTAFLSDDMEIGVRFYPSLKAVKKEAEVGIHLGDSDVTFVGTTEQIRRIATRIIERIDSGAVYEGVHPSSP